MAVLALSLVLTAVRAPIQRFINRVWLRPEAKGRGPRPSPTEPRRVKARRRAALESGRSRPARFKSRPPPDGPFGPVGGLRRRCEQTGTVARLR